MIQGSDEWFLARRGRVTGSIAPAILGMSPYADRRDIMRFLVREREGAEPEKNEFLENVIFSWGKANEAGAIFDYEMETTHSVQPCGFFPYEDWMGASPDGLIGDDGLLEVKSPWSKRKDVEPEFKPISENPHFYAQIQVELFCTGRKWAHLWQHAPCGSKLETVRADQDWIDQHIPVLRQFYAEFLDEPAADHIAPARIVIDTPDAARMIREWDEITEQLELAGERKKDLLAEIVALACERNALISGRKLTMTERVGAISYAKVVKDHLPKLDLSPYRGKPITFWGIW